MNKETRILFDRVIEGRLALDGAIAEVRRRMRGAPESEAVLFAGVRDRLCRERERMSFLGHLVETSQWGHVSEWLEAARMEGFLLHATHTGTLEIIDRTFCTICGCATGVHHRFRRDADNTVLTVSACAQCGFSKNPFYWDELIRLRDEAEAERRKP